MPEGQKPARRKTNACEHQPMEDEEGDKRLVKLRAFPREAVVVARARGALQYGRDSYGAECWFWRDEFGGCKRRLDGKTFRTKKGPAKALDVPGHSGKRVNGWPVGATIASTFPDVLMCEGAPDGVRGHDLALRARRSGRVGVVVMMGAKLEIHASAFRHFKGRRVRIVAHTDVAGCQAARRWAKQLLACGAAEVSIVNLHALVRADGKTVSDLDDLAFVDRSTFDAHPELAEIANFDVTGGRIEPFTGTAQGNLPGVEQDRQSPDRTQDALAEKGTGEPQKTAHRTQDAHDAQETHETKETDEGKKREKRAFVEITAEILALAAARFAAKAHNTARPERWKLLRELKAIEKRAGRTLTISERLIVFDAWRQASLPFLDPEKTRGDYLARFLAEQSKVRVATGDGDLVETALRRINALPLPEIPGLLDAEESWRRVLAMHREMARQTGCTVYFLGSRDSARAAGLESRNQANTINHALVSCGAIRLVRVGDQFKGGKASEWEYLGEMPPLPDAPELPQKDTLPDDFEW